MSRIERPLPGLLLAALGVASLAGCGGDDSRSGAAASAGLLFVRDDAGGVPDLMHARISSGEVRALTSTASRAERRPLWVRGQQRILFESSRAAPGDPPRLVLLDPATGRESSLTPNLGWIERSAALAPDGRSVVYAFISPLEALPPAGLKRQGILSRHEEVMIEGPREILISRIDHAPQSDLVAVQLRVPGRKGVLALVRADGRIPLAADPAFDHTKPSFTHDGSAVVFTRRKRPMGPGDVAIVDASTSAALRLVASSSADEHSAVASPTRSELAFVSTRDGGADILLADLDGGNVRALTRTADTDEIEPVWSPDGERVAFVALPRRERGGAFPGTGRARVVVADRSGSVLFEAPGRSPSFAPLFD